MIGNRCHRILLQRGTFPLVVLNLLLLVRPSSAWIFQPFQQIQKDYLALTRRVTARHILLPPQSEPACLTLKQKIREASADSNCNCYIVDAFERAARRHSRDETTRARGGLLGELVPQGHCCHRSEALDRACFEARLGVVEGPIASEFGNHLILVTERTNCPQLDGENTKVVRKEEGGSNEAVLVPSRQVGQVDLSFAVGQVFFWIAVFFAGGILAEVVASLLS